MPKRFPDPVYEIAMYSTLYHYGLTFTYPYSRPCARLSMLLMFPLLQSWWPYFPSRNSIPAPSYLPSSSPLRHSRLTSDSGGVVVLSFLLAILFPPSSPSLVLASSSSIPRSCVFIYPTSSLLIRIDSIAVAILTVKSTNLFDRYFREIEWGLCTVI